MNISGVDASRAHSQAFVFQPRLITAETSGNFESKTCPKQFT